MSREDRLFLYTVIRRAPLPRFGLNPAMASTDQPVEAEFEDEQKVTPLELYFDLVFVFALTQVTALLAADLTGQGVVRGLLMLAALWWAWTGYAWLTNSIDPNATLARIVVFTATAAMLVASLAVPDAFGDDALVFSLAYLVFRVLQVGLFLVGTRAHPEVQRAFLRIAPALTLAPLALIGASFADGWLQIAIWATALTIDFGAPLVADNEGYDVSPGHFAERHGLIIIIALGESIVSVGAGAPAGAIDTAVIAAAVCGVMISAFLWWVYFDVVAIVAERRLHAATGSERASLARDSYSYLHLPMVAGIVLVALGVKKSLGYLGEPLDVIPAIALGGGLALYLVAHILFRLRNIRTYALRRFGFAAMFLATIPVALVAPALVTLVLVTAICVGQTAYEAIRFRDARHRIRAATS